MEALAVELDEYIAERLKSDDYASIQQRLVSVDNRAINFAYLNIFPQLFNRYIELTDVSEDSNSEESLFNAINYISGKVDVIDRYTSVSMVCKDAHSAKSLLLLCKLIEEILSINKEIGLVPYILDGLRNDILPHFLRELRILAKEINAEQYVEILQISISFINIFRDSYCKKFFLLDDLVTYVLSYLPIFEQETVNVLQKYISVYDQNMVIQPKPLLLAVSLHEYSLEVSFGWLVPFLVYSSIYNLRRCVPVFLEALEKSENNPNCLSHIGISLKAIITPLDEGCLTRDLLPLYMEFIGKFLAVSVYPVMPEDLRMELLRICKDMIYKFEPIAQVLIIKRIMYQILNNKYENILEPQSIAWLLDCYRAQLGKYECFRNELGYLWANLSTIKYENMHDSVNFYAALMILAQYQALLKINKPLLKIVKHEIIDPLESKIAEWSHLMKITKDDGSQTVPYLQAMMAETCKFISSFLGNSAVLQ